MDYNKLLHRLEKYGRDNGYAYVCDSFRPQLRQDKKYQQWKRLVNTATLRAMTPQERRVLDSLLCFRMHHAKEAAKPVRTYNGM